MRSAMILIACQVIFMRPDISRTNSFPSFHGPSCWAPPMPGTPRSLIYSSRAAHSTLSANFDPLIEIWAKTRAEGGINGRRINFISYDDAYSPPRRSSRFGSSLNPTRSYSFSARSVRPAMLAAQRACRTASKS